MTNVVTIRILEELRRFLSGHRAYLFVGTEGLRVSEAAALRAALAGAELEVQVVRNRLASRVFSEAGVGLDGLLRGQTAIIPTDEEGVIAGARILVGWSKDHPKLELRGGILEGAVLDAAALRALAQIPSRPIFLSQVLGAILAPASAIASLVQATLSLPARLALALEQAGGGKGADDRTTEPNAPGDGGPARESMGEAAGGPSPSSHEDEAR